jgi:hypothetical protein
VTPEILEVLQDIRTTLFLIYVVLMALLLVTLFK